MKARCCSTDTGHKNQSECVAATSSNRRHRTQPSCGGAPSSEQRPSEVNGLGSHIRPGRGNLFCQIYNLR